MIRILFIDDEEMSIDPARKWIKGKFANLNIAYRPFGKPTEEFICEFQPDLVILDLFEGEPVKGVKTGNEAYKYIWKTKFCPIVIYSALPDIEEKDHPFVKIVQKGTNSEAKVEESIKELMPQIDAIIEAEKYIRYQFSVALREVAPNAFKMYPNDASVRNNIILRSGRRRLAAFMDEQSRLGTDIASWEQYLFPPVSSNVWLGDILLKIDENPEDPTSFRVVLSPSCDMAAEDGKRKPKIERVLVGRCCDLRKGLDLMGMNIEREELRKRLSKEVLSQGYCKSIVPLPNFEPALPSMMLNLKDLELISIDDKGYLEKSYKRIASLDSPFRELISWAYMQIACRPGLPERNLDAWRDDIISKAKPDEKKK